MIKIMIVDDEIWVRTSLKNKIDWSDNLILCGEASNGFEALELAGNLRPDILITDVRMPGMDGLELIAHMRELFPNLKAIVISGYNEFSYAKSAIELSASGYILKPLHKEELDSVIGKTISEIHRDNLLHHTTQTQLELFHTFLHSFYQGKPVSRERFCELIENLNFHSERTWVLLIRFLDSQENLDNAEQELSKVTASISSQYAYYIFMLSDTLYGIYLTSQFPIDVLQYSRTLLKHLKTKVSLDVSIAFSTSATCFEELPLAFRTARNGLNLMHPYSTHEIILPQTQEDEHPEVIFPREIIQDIIDSVYSHSLPALEKAIMCLNNFIKNTSAVTFFDSNHLFYLLLGELMRILYEWNCPKELTEEGIAFMKELSEHHPGKDYLQHLHDFCQRILSSTQPKISIAQSIQKAEQYIQTNYQKNISLKEIAALFFMNVSYFSVSFKNITGKNFSEYLTAVRMEQAKLLLKNSTLKVNQIARMVGYDDCSYFGKSFRKYTGFIPSEYQKQKKGER